MSDSPKTSVKRVLADAEGMAARRLERKRKELDTRGANNISENPLARMLLDTNLDPEQKRDQMVEFLAFGRSEQFQGNV